MLTPAEQTLALAEPPLYILKPALFPFPSLFPCTPITTGTQVQGAGKKAKSGLFWYHTESVRNPLSSLCLNDSYL